MKERIWVRFSRLGKTARIKRGIVLGAEACISVICLVMAVVYGVNGDPYNRLFSCLMAGGLLWVPIIVERLAKHRFSFTQHAAFIILLAGGAVAGSVAVEEDGKYFNRFFLVTPEGKVMHYDKRHLFTFGGEHRRFTPGRERVVMTYRGLRILPEICYDLRFPVWSRNRGDYDMIIYVASWPEQRADVWRQLLRARAIENRCYVAGVNRCGKDPYNGYAGGTVLLDPDGKALAECRDGIEGYASAEIDLSALEEARRRFPVLDDADDFTLECRKRL